MAVLAPVDRLEVQVLVDNVTDSLSTVPGFVEREIDYHWRRGMRRLSGDSICRAAHGFSCLITAHRAAVTRTLLFDAGPEGDVLALNVARLGAGIARVESIVLSHGHWDHGGGLLRALDMIRRGNADVTVPVFVHPHMFGSRAVREPNGAMRPMEDVPGIPALGAHGAAPVNSAEPHSILDDMFWISGEIPRATAFETGFPGQHRRTPGRSDWELDEAVIDERFVAVNVAGKGVVVFTACSHAGIINVLTHAAETLPDVPLHAVVGGLHLAGATEPLIPQTVEALRAFRLTTIAAAHCTGWRALGALGNAFGDTVVTPSAVGRRYLF